MDFAVRHCVLRGFALLVSRSSGSWFDATDMAEIYHMVLAETWAAVSNQAEYRAESLESEGFIHCTAGERNLLEVAQRFYRGNPGEWLVLVLDPARIRSEVRWAVQPDGLAYPHIHGPLNLDAVIEVRPFPRDSSGAFLLFRD